MTREEQTDWLCRLRADLNNGVIFTPWNKEFTEALTGILEQQPTNDVTLKDIFCMGCEYKEQEPKTGHWINGNYHIRCSECGEDYPYRLRNFCPNCGAKMVESQERKDKE